MRADLMTLTQEQHQRLDSWPKYLSVDPHDRKCWYLQWGMVTPRNDLIVLDEWPQEHFWDAQAPGFGSGGYADMIRQIEAGENSYGVPFSNVVWRIMDPGFGRSPKATTGLTLQQELLDYDLSFDCNVDRDLASGHLLIRERLADGTLIILEPCHNLRYAMARYTFDEYRSNPQGMLQKERPREEYKDPVDALRYALKADLYYFDVAAIRFPRVRYVRNMGLQS